MKDFLDFIYKYRNSPKTYETKRYVLFSQLEEAGYSKTDIFNYITEANKKGLVYNENNIYEEERVALSAKGEFYLKHIIEKSC